MSHPLPKHLDPKAYVPYTNVHIWQMNDGRWHVSHTTNDSGPTIPARYLESGFETRREAIGGLEKARADFQRAYDGASVALGIVAREAIDLPRIEATAAALAIQFTDWEA